MAARIRSAGPCTSARPTPWFFTAFHTGWSAPGFEGYGKSGRIIALAPKSLDIRPDFPGEMRSMYSKDPHYRPAPSVDQASEESDQYVGTTAAHTRRIAAAAGTSRPPDEDAFRVTAHLPAHGRSEFARPCPPGHLETILFGLGATDRPTVGWHSRITPPDMCTARHK